MGRPVLISISLASRKKSFDALPIFKVSHVASVGRSVGRARPSLRKRAALWSAALKFRIGCVSRAEEGAEFNGGREGAYDDDCSSACIDHSL